jgi:hypothetical protein
LIRGGRQIHNKIAIAVQLAFSVFLLGIIALPMRGKGSGPA